jgi:hypothetical protein
VTVSWQRAISKRMSGRAEAAHIGEATDYLCDDGCCVDLNGYARGFTSRTDRAATGGRLGRQRNEGVVG